MEKWKATLSNGEVVDEHDMKSWRKLKAKCLVEGLKIRSLQFEGEEVDPRAISYFVIFDAVAFLFAKDQRFRRGVGSFRSNGKARIIWRTLEGNIQGGDYTEIVQPKNTSWQEVAILVERSDHEPDKQTTAKRRNS